MNFANIQMLFLIWILPLLLLVYVYGWRRRRNILHRFADSRALHLLVPPGMAARRRLRATLVLAAALLLIIAMARPRYGFEWQKVERRGVDLVIALDCSRSMLAQDIKPTRLARAKREISDLLGMLQGDRVGLVAYSGSAFLQCPLTLDYSAFDLFLNVLTPDYMPLGGTDLNAALQTAMSAFDPKSPADKAVILITDGEQTGQGDPEKAAEELKKAGIKLFCIGVGSAGGVPVPAANGGFEKDDHGQIVLTHLDEALLTRMAVLTGGTYVRSVAGDMDLDVIYRDGIRGGMKQTTLQSGRKQVWAERFQWPLLLAILLLLTAGLVPAVKKPLMSLLVGLAVLLPPAASHAGPLQEGYRAYRQGHYKEARRQFVQGQLQDPDNPEVLYNLGNAYYKTGNYQAAKSNYSQALSQASPQLKAKLLYNMGNADYRLGALPQAVKNYKAALHLAPKDKQIRENLAFVKKRLKQQKQQQQQKQNEQQNNQQQQQSRQQQQNSPSKKKPDKASKGSNASSGRPQSPDKPQPSQQQAPNQAGAKSDKNRNTPHNGSEMKKQDNPSGSAPSAQSSPESANSNTDRQQEISSSAAAHMLNRLKDEPGRAMMPSYGRQTVDKDW
jgi:Ca-activated chloride channel family protein